MLTVAKFVRSTSPNSLVMMVVVLFIGCLAAACSSSKEVNYTPPDGSAGPAINHFSFSKMIIDGQEFNEMDIAISSDGKVAPWQIGTVHVVTPADIETLIGPSTRELIIGTGANGVSEVRADALAHANAKGVKVHVLDTAAAVKLFNTMPKEGLAAAFHTGC